MLVSMSDEDLRLTAEDIANLNRDTIARSAAFLRLGGTLIGLVGVVGMVAWAWYEVRLQQNVGDSPLIFNATTASAGGLELGDRIDLLAGSMSLLVLSSLALGLGLAARHLGDYTQARTGASLTGYAVGDTIEADDADEL
jgi:hypothetical protein